MTLDRSRSRRVDAAPRRRRRGAARRRTRHRAGDAPCRAVRRPASRRHGGRDHQDRAARAAGPASRVGQGAVQGALSVVARAVAQQEVLHAQPPRGARARAPARAREAQRRAPRELPPRHARALEPRARAVVGRKSAARDRARLGLRPDGAVQPAGGLRLGRRGHGRHPLHQRLPR
jgi:hypothetical protein